MPRKQPPPPETSLTAQVRALIADQGYLHDHERRQLLNLIHEAPLPTWKRILAHIDKQLPPEPEDDLHHKPLDLDALNKKCRLMKMRRRMKYGH